MAYNYFSKDTGELEDAYPDFDFDESMKIFEIVPMLRFAPVASEDSPPRIFIQAGYGLFNFKSTLEVSRNGQSVSDTYSESDGGLSLGIGFVFGKNKEYQFELLPCYNIVYSEGESTKYFSVNLGIRM